MSDTAHSFASAGTLARRLRVHGKVQGVYFRQSTVEQARRLGVAGWVRNRRDGSVEALLVGPEATVMALIGWMHTGPAAARVDRVDVCEEVPPVPLPEGFVQGETV